jgi:hypothetical protein
MLSGRECPGVVNDNCRLELDAKVVAIIGIVDVNWLFKDKKDIRTVFLTMAVAHGA